MEMSSPVLWRTLSSPSWISDMMPGSRLVCATKQMDKFIIRLIRVWGHSVCESLLGQRAPGEYWSVAAIRLPGPWSREPGPRHDPDTTATQHKTDWVWPERMWLCKALVYNYFSFSISTSVKNYFFQPNSIENIFLLFRDKRMIGGQGKDVLPTLLSQADIFYWPDVNLSDVYRDTRSVVMRAQKSKKRKNKIVYLELDHVPYSPLLINKISFEYMYFIKRLVYTSKKSSPLISYLHDYNVNNFDFWSILINLANSIRFVNIDYFL